VSKGDAVDWSARLRIALGLAAGSALLGSCAQSHPGAVPGGSPSSTPPTTQVPKTHTQGRDLHSDQSSPPRRVGEFVVTQLSVERPVLDQDGHPLRPDRPGLEFWGEEVRTCVKASSDHRETVGWNDWRARARSGHGYPARAGGVQQLPRPRYPFHDVLSPGECASGWVLIPVPTGSVIAGIEFAPNGGAAVAEWLGA
jgi:hypothetical protein